MSDAPIAAPAPSAPAAAPAATPAPSPHHAALQSRTPEGKFNGPPDPAKATQAPAATPAPAAPKTWKLGDKEFSDPDALYAYAQEKDAEARALDDYRRRESEASKRARELEERTRDPRKALTPEIEEEILQRKIREFQEREALAAMPEEQRRLYLLHKQVQKEKAELEAEKAERARVAKEAEEKAKAEAEEKEQAAIKEELKETLVSALEIAGLPPTAYNFHRLTQVVRGAAERGVVYPPEVLARKVKVAIQNERREFVKSAEPESLLRDLPELVEKLNAVKDPTVLRLLAPLGDLIRRLNLEALGAKPTTAAPVPATTGVTQEEANLPPGDPRWAEVFKRRARGG